MEGERVVAGLSCGEVLAALSDYVDGAPDPGRRDRIERHLRGCDWCARFGREFSGMVRMLRRRLAQPPPLAPTAARRLRRRLGKEIP